MDLPKEGFCRTRNKKIIEFLKTIFPESSKTKTKFTTDHIGVAWDKRDFWSINRVSDKPIKPEISEKTLLEIIGLNSIEKWAVNSYVVVVREDYQGTGHKLTKEPKLPLRLIGQISHKWDDSTTALKNIDTKYGNWVCEKDLFKWFPTLEESEKFRDDSLLAKKSYVKCNSEDEYKFIKERIRTYHPGIFNKDRCIIDLNRPSPTLKITLTMKENPESIMS
ncbi:MAG: hypothetical protein PF569_03205, partial [Candidatus Woesearchaeota archaeon]|nr:hypothetical protein [Candidatus Woesearchaeota archaeon]